MSRIGAILLSATVAFSLPVADADISTVHYPSYLKGADGVGAILMTGNNFVSVESETLTFDLRSLESGKDYGTAKIKTVLRNSGGEAAELRMALPFGKTAGYSIDCPQKSYKVEVNGNPVSCTLRYTYAGGSEFLMDEELSRLDGAEESDFYSENLLVTEYEYKVDVTGAGKGFAFLYDCNPIRTRVVFSVEGGEQPYVRIVDGKAKAWVSLKEGQHTIRVNAIGAPLISYEGVVSDGTNSAPAPTPDVRRLGFSDFALSGRAEKVSESDWYRAFVNMLDANTTESWVNVAPALSDSRLMRWYEYSVHIPAGSSVEHVVTFPLRPAINSRVGERYEYSYLLSPSNRWENYGNLNVNVITGYKLGSSSLQFTEAEEGYSLSRDSLPLGNLTFTVIGKEQTAEPMKPYSQTDALKSALTILVIFFVIASVAIGVLLHKQRLQSERVEHSLCSGKAEEGKVDLGDDNNRSDE